MQTKVPDLSALPLSLELASLQPHRYTLLKPIPVVVQPDEGAYVATFFDANINASGESQLEAFESLKEALVGTYALFCEREAELGREPRRQLATLREFIR